ncbi:hypothetical protein [Lysobacter gummosus]|uniref:hypothetical protein n=1 Tax=Lysobacter gummosus TaxID=262324 RepID=UPI003628AC95
MNSLRQATRSPRPTPSPRHPEPVANPSPTQSPCCSPFEKGGQGDLLLPTHPSATNLTAPKHPTQS